MFIKIVKKTMHIAEILVDDLVETNKEKDEEI
jgi:hypothetical protein